MGRVLSRVLLFLAAHTVCVFSERADAASGKNVKTVNNIKRFSALSAAAALSRLPPELLHLITRESLSQLPASALAGVVKAHKLSEAMTEECTTAVTLEERKVFLSALAGARLSTRTQNFLAASLVKWYPDVDTEWKFERFNTTLQIGNPLLAFLPRNFLASLNNNQIIKFLFHLRSWRWVTSRYDEWARKPRAVQRSWAELLLRSSFPVPLSQWTATEMQMQGFLLSGATADELSTLKLGMQGFMFLFNKTLEPLKARVVFDLAFPQRKSRQISPPVELLKRQLPLLTPMQLQSLDLNRMNLSEVNSAEHHHPKESWATARQMVESLIIQIGRSGSLMSGVNLSTLSTQSLRQLGHWVHSLPASILRKINAGAATGAVLGAMDSRRLSGGQARVLLGERLASLSTEAEQRVVLQLRWSLLLGVRGASVAALGSGQLPQRVLTHLLNGLPASSTAALPVYLKALPILDTAIDSILLNRNPDTFLRLVPSSYLPSIVYELVDSLRRMSASKTELQLRTLSLVLGHWRRQHAGDQTGELSDLLQEVPALLPGLRCEELRLLGSEATLPVLVALGEYTQLTGGRYPRDLQHCGLKALIQYLERRIILQRQNVSLLDSLKLGEIQSIGGYLLARVPSEHLRVSANWKPLVQAVGRLPVPHLLEAMLHTSETGPMQLAKMALDLQLTPDLATLELLGNLLQFVPASEMKLAERLDARSFRLWLEGLEPRSFTALCVDKKNRNEFWLSIIMEAYGHPSSWSAGTLATLSGLLIAVPNYKLYAVPTASWRDAADQLNADIGYNTYFVQMCMKYLGPSKADEYKRTVDIFLRRLLVSSQMLAESIKKPEVRPVVNVFPMSRPQPNIIKSDFARNRSILAQVLKNLIPPAPTYKPTTENSVLESFEDECDDETTERTEKTLRVNSKVPRRPWSSRPMMNALFSSNSDQSFHSEFESINTAKVLISPDNEKSKVNYVSCGAIKMAPQAATATLTDSDLTAMATAGELEDCLETLGTLKLQDSSTHIIWRLIRAKNISVDVLSLGRLLSRADLAIILRQANLTDLDTVTALGRHLDDWDTMYEVSALVLSGQDTSSGLSDELVGAMGTLVCGVPPATLLARVPSQQFIKIYRALEWSLSKASSCPPAPCLQTLVTLASGEMAYGPVSSWTMEDLSSLGIIAAGLQAKNVQEMASKPRLTAGFTADALRCIGQDSLAGNFASCPKGHTHMVKMTSQQALMKLAFSLDQLGNLSLSALLAIPDHLLEHHLPPTHADAVHLARRHPVEHLFTSFSRRVAQGTFSPTPDTSLAEVVISSAGSIVSAVLASLLAVLALSFV